MKRFLMSKAAQADRDAIDDDTIARFGLIQAVRARGMFKAALEELLSTMPLSERLQPDLCPPDRHLCCCTVMGKVVVIYEATIEGIKVVRILDGAKRLRAELLEEPVDEP